jgi:hypothetical protein
MSSAKLSASLDVFEPVVPLVTAAIDVEAPVLLAPESVPLVFTPVVFVAVVLAAVVLAAVVLATVVLAPPVLTAVVVALMVLSPVAVTFGSPEPVVITTPPGKPPPDEESPEVSAAPPSEQAVARRIVKLNEPRMERAYTRRSDHASHFVLPVAIPPTLAAPNVLLLLLVGGTT